MNPFFVYLIKSTISLALFYIVFKLAVSRDKMHSVNRFVLLGILATSAILPLAEIPVLPENRVIPQVEVFRQIVEAPVFNNPLPSVSGEIQTVQPTNTLSVNPVLLIYLFAIILLLVRLIISLFRVAQLIQKAEKQSFRNYMLAVVKDFIQPFSFLKNIVISEKDYTENKEMVITHEYAHIRYFHAVDLVICELFTALHWFNPFVWLLRRDLKLIHEYQADQAVLNKGIDAAQYQLLVIEKAVGERRFAMASHFTQKPILKRIKMMKKENKNRWNKVKLIVFVPVVLLLLQAFARPEMIPDKISEIVPSLSFQRDSSEIWLENWTIENLSKINGGLITEEYEVSPPPPGSSKSGLAKYDKEKHGKQIPMTNILTIMVNWKSEILACGSKVESDELMEGVKKFLNGNSPFESVKKGPELEEKNLPFVGNVKISKGVITLRYDLDTKKDFIDKLLRSIGKIHLEEREKLAAGKFNKDYFSLSADEKTVINQMLPIRISVMEPKNIRKVGQNQIKQANQHSSLTNAEKYDVVIYKDRIEVQNENCKLDELNEKIEKVLKKEKDKRSIAILTFDDVPPERLKKVKFEINNIPNFRISTTIVKLKETDTESVSYKILLKENGNIYLNNERYSLQEFENQIGQLAKNTKSGSTTGYIFEIENNTTYLQVETVKEIMRKANFKQEQQEIKHHSVSELTPFADNTQTSNVVGLSISSPLTSQQLDRLMSSAKNYLKKPNTIEAVIYRNPKNTEKDIEILKKELMKAGFKKVTVETKG